MQDIYKDIKLFFNDESWRYDRLKSVVDFLEDKPHILEDETPTIEKIVELEDDKGTLKIYIIARLSDYEKFWIKWIWEDNNEKKVKFIKYIKRAPSPTFCPHCSKEPQIEDEEIKQYFNYLNYNNNI